MENKYFFSYFSYYLQKTERIFCSDITLISWAVPSAHVTLHEIDVPCSVLSRLILPWNSTLAVRSVLLFLKDEYVSFSVGICFESAYIVKRAREMLVMRGTIHRTRAGLFSITGSATVTSREYGGTKHIENDVTAHARNLFKLKNLQCIDMISIPAFIKLFITLQNMFYFQK